MGSTPTAVKNSVHGILLQEGIRIPGVTFTETYNKKLMSLGDYRIDGFVRQINHLNLQIADYSSLVISSEIADIGRFNDSHKLCAYAGVVPSVRNSADVIHHGSITKRGSMTLRWILTECVYAHTCQEQ